MGAKFVIRAGMGKFQCAKVRKLIGINIGIDVKRLIFAHNLTKYNISPLPAFLQS
jgi:hypothetical protein